MAEVSGNGGGSLSPTAIVLFILAFFGVGAPLMLSTARTTSVAANSMEKNPIAGEEKDAVDLLEGFFDANPEPYVDVHRPWQFYTEPYPKRDAPWSLDDPRRNDRISFLIATLPNPDNPSLRNEFDRYLDSIQRALSHEFYLLDKTCLITKPAAGESTSINSSERLRHPGVMLFHRDEKGSGINPTPHSLLVVFVVGETPTGGVDAGAMRSALDQIAWLRQWNGYRGEPLDDFHAATLNTAFDGFTWLRGFSGIDELSLLQSFGGGTPLFEATIYARDYRPEFLQRPRDGHTLAPKHLVELTRSSPEEIKIIGPTYSGSATSVQEVLRSWLHYGKLAQAPEISLFSGAATAIENWPEKLGHYQSTQLPEAETYERAMNFFENELHVKRIALLTENTSYGQLLVSKVPSRSYGQLLVSKVPSRSSRHPINSVEVTLLPYPIHISNVRTAYEGLRSQQASPAISPIAAERRDPSISDEDPGADRYLAPSFSRVSAAGDEVVLANLLDTIHQENFRYVGIVATNIQDAIFLAHEIRDNCPDAIPFLTSADLLYLHSDLNHDLVGTLIFSTYPLFASNQLWTWPSTIDPRRFQFPSGEAEGEYNATLAALDAPDQMVEYTFPFLGGPKDRQIPLVKESKKSMNRVPPLWVSVVGNESLWPVSVYQNEPGANVLKRQLDPTSEFTLPSNFGISLYPIQFTITFALIILLCTLPQLYFIKWHSTSGAQVSAVYRILGQIIPAPPRWLINVLNESAGDVIANRSNRHLSVLLFVLVSLTLAIGATTVWLLPLFAMKLWTPSEDASGQNYFFLFWTLLPVTIVVVFTCLGFAGITSEPTGQVKQPHDRASRKIDLRLAAKAGLFIVFTFILLLGFLIWKEEPLYRLLYFVRATNLWNGVSPALPMLYIAMTALWVRASDLRRMGLSDQYVLIRNFLGFGNSGSFSGLASHERATVRLLKCSTSQIQSWWLWLLPPVVIYFLLDFPGLHSIALDGRAFTLCFIGAAFFVYISLLLMCARLIAIWFQLRCLLQRLYMHPTRCAYEELRIGTVAPSMADRQHIRLLEPSESVVPIEFCLERVRDMLRQLDRATPRSGSIAGRVSDGRLALSAQVAAIQPLLDAFLQCEARFRWPEATALKFQLQKAMANLSRLVTEIFEPWWRLDRQSHPAIFLNAKLTPERLSVEESLIKDADLFVASRVVDFLRQVFPQMKSLIISVSVGLLALMLAVSSYPFPHRDTIAWISWIVLLSIIGVTFYIFIQINRDRVVSMLLGTTPGELNWNSSFIWQLVVFGLIPILTLLGAQFPHAMQSIFSSFGGALGGAR